MLQKKKEARQKRLNQMKGDEKVKMVEKKKGAHQK
jgi:hypothetical protein